MPQRSLVPSWSFRHQFLVSETDKTTTYSLSAFKIALWMAYLALMHCSSSWPLPMIHASSYAAFTMHQANYLRVLTPNQLQQSLAKVQDFVHQHISCAPLPNPQRISSAMKVCESRSGVLAKLVDVFTISLNYQSLMQRRLAAMKLFTAKDQIRKFQIQLRESTWNLLTAPMINSNNLE